MYIDPYSNVSRSPDRPRGSSNSRDDEDSDARARTRYRFCAACFPTMSAMTARTCAPTVHDRDDTAWVHKHDEVTRTLIVNHGLDESPVTIAAVVNEKGWPAGGPENQASLDPHHGVH